MRLFPAFAGALMLSGTLFGTASAGRPAQQTAMQMDNDAGSSQAADPQGPLTRVGAIEISGAWTRAMLPGAKAGGGFVTIVNTGSDADRLVSATSPAAPKVEIHSMVVENGIMKMHPLKDGLDIPPGATVRLKPGSFHIMFLDVPKRFEKGTTVPVTLTFEKAGPVTLDLIVAGPGAKTMP